ncbi:hypothetical protein VP01_1318g2 [Puccinia sorghi]|uniref:Uncharacterized protein n=1 Tax=Puccinia sorghi TaxID=27349 RepID=A0A0L6VNA6_9BASI|nr:hypothetical protein VP01_1318g2 [Puccinia sorghi]
MEFELNDELCPAELPDMKLLPPHIHRRNAFQEARWGRLVDLILPMLWQGLVLHRPPRGVRGRANRLDEIASWLLGCYMKARKLGRMLMRRRRSTSTYSISLNDTSNSLRSHRPHPHRHEGWIHNKACVCGTQIYCRCESDDDALDVISSSKAHDHLHCSNRSHRRRVHRTRKGCVENILVHLVIPKTNIPNNAYQWNVDSCFQGSTDSAFRGPGGSTSTKTKTRASRHTSLAELITATLESSREFFLPSTTSCNRVQLNPRVAPQRQSRMASHLILVMAPQLIWKEAVSARGEDLIIDSSSQDIDVGYDRDTQADPRRAKQQPMETRVLGIQLGRQSVDDKPVTRGGIISGKIRSTNAQLCSDKLTHRSCGSSCWRKLLTGVGEGVGVVGGALSRGAVPPYPPKNRFSTEPLSRSSACSAIPEGPVVGAGTARLPCRSERESRLARNNCMFTAWDIFCCLFLDFSVEFVMNGEMSYPDCWSALYILALLHQPFGCRPYYSRHYVALDGSLFTCQASSTGSGRCRSRNNPHCHSTVSRFTYQGSLSRSRSSVGYFLNLRERTCRKPPSTR